MTYVNDGALHRHGSVGLPGRAVKLTQDRLDTPLVGRTEVTPASDSTPAQPGTQCNSGGALRAGVAGFKGTRTSEVIMVQNSFGAQGRTTVGAMTCEVLRLQRVEGAARLPYSLKVPLENLLRNEYGAGGCRARSTRLSGRVRHRPLGRRRVFGRANYFPCSFGRGSHRRAWD
jgi:hypothetical protein